MKPSTMHKFNRLIKINPFSSPQCQYVNDLKLQLQGLKRLITRAQKYYPTDPSRSIDYVRRTDVVEVPIGDEDDEDKDEDKSDEESDN